LKPENADGFADMFNRPVPDDFKPKRTDLNFNGEQGTIDAGAHVGAGVGVSSARDGTGTTKGNVR